MVLLPVLRKIAVTFESIMYTAITDIRLNWPWVPLSEKRLDTPVWLLVSTDFVTCEGYNSIQDNT